MNLVTFWPIYLRLHSKRSTQIMHTIGLVAAYLTVLLALATGQTWYILAAPMIGYWFAFSGHFLFEKNKPASFDHFWLSLYCDHKLCWLVLTGKL